MWSIRYIYLIVSLITLFKRQCNAEHFVNIDKNVKHTERSPMSDRESMQVVGLSRSAYAPNPSVSERSVALAEALRLLQSFTYHLVEFLRGAIYKLDIHIRQPITHFLRSDGRSEKYRKNDHIDCDIETLGLPAYKLKRIYEILAKRVLQSESLHKRANATHFCINPHLIYRYLAAADWSQKYNGRRLVHYFLLIVIILLCSSMLADAS